MSDEKPTATQFLGYLKEKRSLWWITAAMIVGVFLMVFGSGWTNRSDGGKVLQTDPTISAQLEEKVRALCAEINGVGKVSVMITLDTVGEQIYAQDVHSSLDGERRQEQKEYVTVSQGLVPIGQRLPRVRGVAIVCSGGDDAAIRLKLTNLLCALFSIPANSVSVVGGN